jgi:lysophospholipid acyltransferase (LPLAT)-like uncharacterized protein
MVSWSRDGALQAAAMQRLGLSVVRGSSSRGGARALAELVRGLRRGDSDAAFAVDGPRGPYGAAKAGARCAARAVRGVLVPAGAAVSSGVVLRRAWDRFGIAWPFSRVVIRLGAPIEPHDDCGEVDVELSRAIALANAEARRALGKAVEYSGVPAESAPM